MKKCVICHVVITDQNDSEEHLIPNSIGGRLVLKGVLCKKCNNVAGDSWDASLSKALQITSLLFNVKRDRGKLQPKKVESVSGKQYYLTAGGGYALGKRVFEQTPTDLGISINVSANTLKEVNSMLSGFYKKNPQISNPILATSDNIKTEYIEEPLRLTFEFGARDDYKSLLKSALCLVSDYGIDASVCDEAYKFICDKEQGVCHTFYYKEDLVKSRQHKSPIHCVAVQGFSEYNNIIGYFELFGSIRIVSCLSREYFGDDFKVVHCIDPVSSNYIDLDIDLRDIALRFDLIAQDSDSEWLSMRACFLSSIDALLKDIYMKEQERIIEAAFSRVIKKYELEGMDNLSECHMNEAFSEISDEVYRLIRSVR